MAINNRTLASVNNDLTAQGTSELVFRNATVDVATQVDANDVDLSASRTLTLTGDVQGTTTFDLSDNTARGISVTTSVTGMSLLGSDIQNNTITNTQIAPNTVRNTEIATNSITQNRIADSAKTRIRILDASGTVLNQFDGLLPNP